jgi:hypothetical protein
LLYRQICPFSKTRNQLIETREDLGRYIIDKLKSNPTEVIRKRNYFFEEGELYYLVITGTDIIVGYKVDEITHTIHPNFLIT